MGSTDFTNVHVGFDVYVRLILTSLTPTHVTVCVCVCVIVRYINTALWVWEG